MMATVPHVISGLGLRKFQADGFLLTRVYNRSLTSGLYVNILPLMKCTATPFYDTVEYM